MADKTDKTVVVAEKRWGKRCVAMLVGGIVVVVLIGAGLWAGLHHRKATPIAYGPQLSATDLQYQVNQDITNRDYDTGIKLIKGQRSFADPATQQLLASIYVAQGDFTSAMNVYAKLDKAKQLSATALASVAMLAEQQKDYKTALHYYEEARATTTPNNSVDASADIAGYEAKITELQKKI